MMTDEPEGARDIGVLSMMIGGPPGTSVCVPMIYADAEVGMAVTGWEFMLKIRAAC